MAAGERKNVTVYEIRIIVMKNGSSKRMEMVDGRVDMATAWMVRKDGKIIPVVQHIYANPENVEESLSAAEWLYRYTIHKKVKRMILNFIRTWAVEELHGTLETIEAVIQEEISRRPYVFLTSAFIEEHWEELSREEAGAEKYTIQEYCMMVTLALNEEFMRVRYGGKYNTCPGSRELYFRISSEDYRWETACRIFLREVALDYERMWLVVDEEAAEVNPKILKIRKYFLADDGGQEDGK